MGEIGAALYEWMLAPLERSTLRARRARVAGGARGRVLEIGIGTGLNLNHYRRSEVTEIVGLEPDEAMIRRAHEKADQLHLPIVWAETGAEVLPFENEYFDTVVATLVFCMIPDPLAALREARRVLKKEGELRLLEHALSAYPRRASLQNALTPLWASLSNGCQLNRDPLPLLEEAGLRVKRVITYESWKLFPIFRIDEITAIRPGY